VTLPTLRDSLRQVARFDTTAFSLTRIREGKFGAILREVTEKAYFDGQPGWAEYYSAMADQSMEGFYAATGEQEISVSDEMLNSLKRKLSHGDRVERVRAAFVSMNVAFGKGRLTPGHIALESQEQTLPGSKFQTLRAVLQGMLDDDPPQLLAVCWALAWIGQNRLCANPPKAEIVLRLFRAWREAQLPEVKRMAAWAFASQELLPRNAIDKDAWGDINDWLKNSVLADPGFRRENRSAAVIVAWYRQAPWNDAELVEQIASAIEPYSDDPTLREILANLGEAGAQVLKQWQELARQ